MSPRSLQAQLLSSKVTPIKWAKVTGGTVTTYTKPTGEVMEVHTFTADGTLTVVQAGYAEVLLVGGGSNGAGGGKYANGGDVHEGLFKLPAGSLAVDVGVNGSTGGMTGGYPSSIAGVAKTSMSWITNTDLGIGIGSGASLDVVWSSMSDPWVSSITGTAQNYAPGQGDSGSTGNEPGAGGTTPKDGVVIVAVRI